MFRVLREVPDGKSLSISPSYSMGQLFSSAFVIYVLLVMGLESSYEVKSLRLDLYQILMWKCSSVVIFFLAIKDAPES